MFYRSHHTNNIIELFNMNQFCIHEYRGLVALNNLGVTLLEQGQYEEAKETFGDAISVLKSALRIIELAEDGEDVSLPYGAGDADLKIQRAVLRSLSKDNRKGIKHLAGSTIFAVCQSVQGAASAPVPNLQHASENMPNIVFPIRMEVDGYLEACFSGSEVDFESAILLHNLGISYLCIGRLSPEGANNNYIKTAAHLHRLAQTLLQRLTATFGDLTFDIELFDGYLRIESIVIHTLITLTLAQDKDSTRLDQYKHRSSWLMQMSNELTSKLNLLCRSNGPAAAAA
jgi:tetratricopeptide (TPR) repeat protein